jgi:DNA-binding MarR family transcriptional regulator
MTADAHDQPASAAGDADAEQRRPLVPLLDDIKQLAIAELHTRLRAEGHPEIRPGHGCVFRFIGQTGSRLTELAAASNTSKQAVGEVVVDLEGLGYVERAPDPLDGRAKIIRLTDLGEEAQLTARRIFGEIEARWAERYGADRIAALRELVEEMVSDQRAGEPLPAMLVEG